MRPLRMYGFAGAIFALVLAAGCGSMGDILGGGGSPSPTTTARELRGTVDRVDTSDRSIVLTNVSYGSNLTNGGGGGNSARVYYDDQTTVAYQGRSYRPEDLERGDEVAIRVQDSGGRLVADTMTVLRDVSGTTGSSYASTIRGTVRDVNTSRQTIELTRSTSSQIVTVQYDANTVVNYNGRQYRAADLERGDEIEMNVSEMSGGRLMANRIDVVRSVTDGTTGTSSLRGTVRTVDTTRRTIELEQASWSSRFDTGRSSSSSVVMQYDTNTNVEYQGKLYPPANLERGDVVDVQVRDLGTKLIAQRIVVVRDVNAMR